MSQTVKIIITNKATPAKTKSNASKSTTDRPKGKAKPAVVRKKPTASAAAAKPKQVKAVAKELCGTKDCKRVRMSDNQYCAGCRCSAANSAGKQCGNPKGVGESGRQRLKFCAFHFIVVSCPKSMVEFVKVNHHNELFFEKKEAVLCETGSFAIENCTTLTFQRQPSKTIVQI
jgi:hypothetical protein